ncbi:MAG: hypothetical protein JJU33_14760 [Phycisphaerales bacterium]|nr:hypothetical protein [Phycisphaerales bacterium]
MLAGLGTAASAQTGSLETTGNNNGSGGVFMDLSPFSNLLSITEFEVAFSGTSGSTVDVEVWVRPGSYVGFDASREGWTLAETVQGVRRGTNTLSSLTLNDPVEVEPGVTTAIYLHAVTSGGGIRYNGTNANPPQTTWTNADLELFSDRARTGDIPFGSSLFMPRTFSGVIHYQLGAFCRPDLNGDEVLDAEDFFLFLQYFEAGDPRADFNNDGVIDANDFFIFLNEFHLGC